MITPLLTAFFVISVIHAPADFDRTLSIEQLVGKLNSDSPQEHAIARQLLPLKSPMEVLPKIVPALGSDNPDISGTAKNILFDITNRMAKAEQAEKMQYINILLNYFADTSLKDLSREYILKSLSLIMDEETPTEILQKFLLEPLWTEKVRTALVENGTLLSAKILCNSLNILSDEGKTAILLGLYQMDKIPCIEEVVSLLDSPMMSIKVASARVIANTGLLLYAPKLFDVCKSTPETEPLYQELWDAYIRLAEKSALNGGNWDYTIFMYRNVIENCKIPAIIESAITGLGRYGDETIIPDLETILLNSDKEMFHLSAFHAIKMLNIPSTVQPVLELCSKLTKEKQLYLLPSLVQINDERGKTIVQNLLEESGSNGKRMLLNAFYENPSLLYINYVPTIMGNLEESEKQKLVECLWRVVASYHEVEDSEKQFMGKAYLYLFKLCPPEEREIVMDRIKKFPTPETVDVLLPELGKEDPKNLPFPLLFELYNTLTDDNKEKRNQIYEILREQLATVPLEKIISSISNSKNLPQFCSLAGFVSKWNLLGPFPWNTQEPFVENYGFPQTISIDTPYKYKDKGYDWKKDVSVEGWGYVGLMGLCSQSSMDCENICAFAYTKIDVSEDTSAFACIGSDDGFRLWINQEEIVNKHVDRGMKVDEDKAEIHFKKGENTILLQITQIKGGWNFCFRLTDASGKPLIFNIKPF
ncbi:MAG: hypothetical protein ACP5UA_07925 [Candidatus Hydrogenedens sp.]